MSKYEVLHPIAWGGRKERGQIVEIPDEAAKNIGIGTLVRPYGGPKEAVNAAEEQDKSIEDLSYSELQDRAKELGLSAGGTGEAIKERIALHLEGGSDDDSNDDESDDESQDDDSNDDESDDSESDE